MPPAAVEFAVGYGVKAEVSLLLDDLFGFFALNGDKVSER